MYCSIVIVTFNSRLTIGDCLSPLVNMPNAEIIVLDNDSKDDTASFIREQFPSIKLIVLQENLGFGRACNIGVAASVGSFVFLLNPDAVAAPQAIMTLCDFLERHPQVGIVGGRFLDPLGRPLQAVGGRPSLFGLVMDKPLGLLAKHIQPRGILRTILGKLSLKFRLSKTSEKVAWALQTVRPKFVTFVVNECDIASATRTRARRKRVAQRIIRLATIRRASEPLRECVARDEDHIGIVE